MATGKIEKYLRFCIKYAEFLDLNCDEMEKFHDEYEDAINDKRAAEEKEAFENYEEDPATVVARENFLACLG